MPSPPTWERSVAQTEIPGRPDQPVWEHHDLEQLSTILRKLCVFLSQLSLRSPIQPTLQSNLRIGGEWGLGSELRPPRLGLSSSSSSTLLPPLPQAPTLRLLPQGLQLTMHMCHSHWQPVTWSYPHAEGTWLPLALEADTAGSSCPWPSQPEHGLTLRAVHQLQLPRFDPGLGMQGREDLACDCEGRIEVIAAARGSPGQQVPLGR